MNYSNVQSKIIKAIFMRDDLVTVLLFYRQHDYRNSNIENQ